MEILLDFDNGADATRSLKKVAQMMLRAGQPVISTDFDAKVKRTSGISYREALLTVASGQTVTLLVKQTGDIYQVKINGKVTPIKNQDDAQKAIVEIANHLDANQAKFQAALAKQKVDLKETGAKSVAPKMEEKLTAQLAELDTKITDARKKLETGVFDGAIGAGSGDMKPELDAVSKVKVGDKVKIGSSTHGESGVVAEIQKLGILVRIKDPDVAGGYRLLRVQESKLILDSAYYDKDDEVGESITGDGDSDLDDDDKKKKKKDKEDTYVDPEEDGALDSALPKNEGKALDAVGNLTSDEKQALATELTKLLANLIPLSMMLRGFHWNVTGANFGQLHDMFGKQYESVDGRIDEVAERIRALGQLAPASLATLTDLIANESSESMVSAAINGFTLATATAETVNAMASGLGDTGTVNLVSGIIEEFEKAVWMLNSSK